MSATRGEAPVSPTVARIVTVLEDRIRSGQYREGEWLPTERDLAVDFKVSRILIRSAIKELERRDYITCFEHRRPLIRRRHIGPQALKASTRSLALWIWPDASWQPAGKTIQGVHEALGDEFRLVLGCPVGSTWEEAKASEARFLRQVLRDNDIEGLLLEYMGGDVNLHALQTLRAAHFPVIFLDHLPPPGYEADYVGVNNQQGAEMAVKHLLSLGHRSIGHVSNYDVMSTVSDSSTATRSSSS